MSKILLFFQLHILIEKPKLVVPSSSRISRTTSSIGLKKLWHPLEIWSIITVSEYYFYAVA
jgi:hypothetical protein